MFAFSYGFNIACILLRQVISLKKMVELSEKFTILILWYPVFISLIHSSALMRLASTSAAINSKDITESFLFSLFESSVMTQIVERVCTAKLLYF